MFSLCTRILRYIYENGSKGNQIKRRVMNISVRFNHKNGDFMFTELRN